MTAKSKRVELKPTDGGYRFPTNPDMQGPQLAGDRRRVGERMCMKAKKLEVVSDGSLEGTSIIVDGVQIGGLTRFELVAAKGYKRVSAVATMKYDHADLDVYGESRGQEVKNDDGSPTIVTVDIFTRQ